jgi:predicted Zn-dependent protease
VALLEKALLEAESERNDFLRAEVAANLTALKHRMGRLPYEKAIAAMAGLLRDHPNHESIVMCLAKIASRAREAAMLRSAVARVSNSTTRAQCAYLAHQVAWLEGDNDAAGIAAAEWFDLEPRDPQAAATALVALGIGQERWDEAAAVADFALQEFPTDTTIVNNAGYILAMAGRPAEAIRLLKPLADDEFVIKATLGLACLANGDLDSGMRLYREAAVDAEQMNASWHSLMTVYQALVVRQLGLDKSKGPEVISALAIATVPLPADWRQQPEFVRLYKVCVKHGYKWPVTL